MAQGAETASRQPSRCGVHLCSRPRAVLLAHVGTAAPPVRCAAAGAKPKAAAVGSGVRGVAAAVGASISTRAEVLEHALQDVGERVLERVALWRCAWGGEESGQRSETLPGRGAASELCLARQGECTPAAP